MKRGWKNWDFIRNKMYFVTKEELLSEIEKAVDAIFSAVARMFSEEDKRLNKRLKDLEANFLLLLNTVGYKSYQSKNKKRSKNMEEEERAVRPFEEVLDEVVHYILQSEDHELILMIDELEKSAKQEVEKKEKIKQKLRQIFKKGKDFLKEQGIEKEKEKAES